MIRPSKMRGLATVMPPRTILFTDNDAAEHDPARMLAELKRLSLELFDIDEENRFTNGWCIRNNPGFGQLGLMAQDEKLDEICTIWWRGESQQEKDRLRSCLHLHLPPSMRDVTDAMPYHGMISPEDARRYCKLPSVAEIAPSMIEGNERVGVRLPEPHYLRDLVPSSKCPDALRKAKELLNWYRGLLDALMSSTPGLTEEDLRKAQWREIFGHD